MKEYKFFSRLGYPYVVKTKEEEDDLKAIYRVKDATFKILPGRDRCLDIYDELLDKIDYLIEETNKHNFAVSNLFLVPISVFFALYVALLEFILAVRRIGFNKKLYEEEVLEIYKDTIKIIEKRYRKRILGLSGIPEESEKKNDRSIE